MQTNIDELSPITGRPQRMTMSTLVDFPKRDFPTWISPGLKSIIQSFDSGAYCGCNESKLYLKLWNHTARALETLAEEAWEDQHRHTKIQMSF